VGSRAGRGRRRLRRVLLLGALAAGAVAAARRRAPRWASEEDPCGPEGLALPAGAPLTVATSDGAELDVLVAGPADGPLVVLPHCWTGTKAMWAPVARRLVADGHRIVLYDQRGHGRSTMGEDPMRMERLGEDLRTVLIAVGANDVVLAGHSMGGMTVQALAVAHPDLVQRYVKGIVLVATTAKIGTPWPVPERLAALMLGDAASTRIAKLGLVFTRGAVGLRAHRSHVEATYEAFATTVGSVRAGFLVGMSHMDFRTGLTSLAVPTTVLVGSHDRLTPPRLARALAEAIPEAHLEVVEGAGHMLPLEAPDRVAQVIAERARALVPAASSA
jgi:non-heme chloroperoxidase